MKHSVKTYLLSLALVTLPALALAIDTPRDTLGDGQYTNKQVTYYLNDIQGNTGLGGYDDVANEGPLVTASRIINFLLTLLGTFTLCLMVYAGYLWMMSRGNEEDVTKAKDIMIGCVIGLVLILASYSFTYYVFRSFVNITD